MAAISKLSSETVSRIAAGEVIERPASVIKELLENALDAGANQISIAMEDGGCHSLKVSDNGIGIAAADLPLALARHATSKIASFEDIYHIHSFGFRGEALASIAAIAHVEIVSKPAPALAAARIVADNGKISPPEPCGAPAGTTVTVSGIFDALPVRKKFLKPAAGELALSLEAIARIAIAVPTVRIQVNNNGKEVAFFPSCVDIASRASSVFGASFTETMAPVSSKIEGIRVVGLTSLPPKSAANSRNIHLFVNNRFVKDYLISHAVSGVYRRLLEARRYPFALLFLHIDPAEIDVNVHPSKLEVRFRHPRAVYDVVTTALTRALSLSPREGEQEEKRITETVEYKKRVEEALRRYAVSYAQQSGTTLLPLSETRAGFTYTKMGDPSQYPFASNKEASANAPFSSSPSLEESFFPKDKESIPLLPPINELRYLGAIQATYLLFEEEGGLLIVDQHAAHERLLFEELKADFTSGKVGIQELIIPEVITLSSQEATVLATIQESLTALGFLIEPFGTNTVIIKGTPRALAAISPHLLLADLLDTLVGEPGIPNIDESQEKLLTRLACSAAVKARQALSEKEARGLLLRIEKLAGMPTCPHGRPLMVRVNLPELEKMFKRK